MPARTVGIPPGQRGERVDQQLADTGDVLGEDPQDLVVGDALTVLEAGIAEGQRDGTVRDGDPTLLARSVLLTAHGFLLSATTMTDRRHTLTAFDGELQDLVDDYLHP